MDLIVYGTLRSAALMEAVSGVRGLHAIPATLPDYAVFAVDGNVVPFIAPHQGGAAECVIWQDLGEAALARLDLYEGAFGYSLTSVTAKTADGPSSVMCYLPPEGIKPGPKPWSLQAWEADHLAPGLLAASELFSHDPLPSQSALRAMWPMIEARAWSKHRAKAAPATRRFAPAEADFEVAHARPPQGRFFRFQSADIAHRRFDGRRSETLTREAFIGIDAAVVLPYDPARDRVLLVEQARMGPRMRRDPNPWMLEPVAGIIDARETPQEAALRECHEEAGLTITQLVEANAFYVSPGASTDYFYTFIGVCDLPHTQPYLGGLESEAEDLRLHPMSLDDALALADSGEIATGPALFLLYWLIRHKGRFTRGA